MTYAAVVITNYDSLKRYSNRTMFPLLISSFLAAAPIPKTVYEGQIAVMLRGKQPELVILMPSGREVKRVPLNDLNGTAYTVKLSYGGDRALVTTMSPQAIAIGIRRYTSMAGYFVRLDGSEKPKELFESKLNLKWVLNRDATIAYGTELDQEKAAKAKPTELPTKAWSLDLKSGQYQPIPLPSEHLLIDISHDDKTVLTWARIDGKNRASTAPTSTWKPTVITESVDYPHGLSPDGKKVFLMEYIGTDGKPSNRHAIHDLKTGERRTIHQPEECDAIVAYSYGADGKRIAFVGYSQERTPNDNIVTYRLYVCNADGSNRKMILETKPGETIGDIDWR